MSSQPKSQNKNDKRKETPEAVEFGGDIRKEEGAGKYPHYWSHKTRSGHNFVMDDSKGHESVTLQHRSGSAIQMMPDGAIHITAHNSMYTVVFAENRMVVTGAQDVTVKGDCSLRVYGDKNETIHGNYNLAVNGDFNMTSKNLNRHIRGNMDTQAKNVTKKLEGSHALTAKGAIAHVSEGAFTSASIGDKVHIGGSTGINMAVREGDHTTLVKKGNVHHDIKEGKFDGKYSDGQNEVSMLMKEGEFHMQSDKATNIESKQDAIKMKAQQDIGVESTSGGVQMKTQSGDIQMQSGSNIEVKSQADTHVKATGTAALEGSTTHVGGQSGTTHVVGGNVNVEPLSGMLNLAGGGGIPFGGLSQLSFNFGDILGASGLPQIQSQPANLPSPEEDHKSETDRWV